MHLKVSVCDCDCKYSYVVGSFCVNMYVELSVPLGLATISEVYNVWQANSHIQTTSCQRMCWNYQSKKGVEREKETETDEKRREMEDEKKTTMHSQLWSLLLEFVTSTQFLIGILRSRFFRSVSLQHNRMIIWIEWSVWTAAAYKRMSEPSTEPNVQTNGLPNIETVAVCFYLYVYHPYRYFTMLQSFIKIELNKLNDMVKWQQWSDHCFTNNFRRIFFSLFPP